MHKAEGLGHPRGTARGGLWAGSTPDLNSSVVHSRCLVVFGFTARALDTGVSPELPRTFCSETGVGSSAATSLTSNQELPMGLRHSMSPSALSKATRSCSLCDVIPYSWPSLGNAGTGWCDW